MPSEIRVIRDRLKNAEIVIFTNGDYVTLPVIDNLSKSGLNILRVTLYPNKAIISPSNKRIESWLNRKKLSTYNWSFGEMPDRKGLFATAHFENTLLKVISPNIETYNTRADLVQPLVVGKRTMPCHMTNTSSAIDYLGRLKMCCNIFPDIEKHKNYIIGSLKDHTFLQLWDSNIMRTYRQRRQSADWAKSRICEYCYKLNSFTK